MAGLVVLVREMVEVVMYNPVGQVIQIIHPVNVNPIKDIFCWQGEQRNSDTIMLLILV